MNARQAIEIVEVLKYTCIVAAVTGFLTYLVVILF